MVTTKTKKRRGIMDIESIMEIERRHLEAWVEKGYEAIERFIET